MSPAFVCLFVFIGCVCVCVCVYASAWHHHFRVPPWGVRQDKQVQRREGVCSRMNGLRVLLSPSPLPLSAVGDHGAAYWDTAEEVKKLIAEGADLEAVNEVRCARFDNMPDGVAGLPALSQQLNVARSLRCVPTHGSSQSCVVCECMHG